MEPPKLWLNVRCWKRKTKKPFAVTGVVLSQLTSKTDHRQGDETFCFLKKLSEMTMLTTFYRAKDAHRWVTLISLKMENLIKRWSNVWYWKRKNRKAEKRRTWYSVFHVGGSENDSPRTRVKQMYFDGRSTNNQEKPKSRKSPYILRFFTSVEAKMGPRVLASKICTLTGDLPTIKKSRKAEKPKNPVHIAFLSRGWRWNWLLAK